VGKDTKIVIGIAGDTKSFEKSLDQAARKLERTRKSTKKSKKEVKELGQQFTRAANNVAIFNGQLDPISGRLSAIGTGITRFGLGNVALGVGIAGVGIAVGKLISSLEQFEKRQNKFQGLLKATGFAARLTRNDLEDLAQSTARNTLGDVASTSEAINALLTFRKVQGETFKETIKLAVDAKVVFGGNLREGVVAFGKALNDPIANLGALSRKGIQFTKSQKDMIASMWEMGDTVGAQNIVLAEMRNQFGGLANIEAAQLEAAVDSAGQSWDNFLESLGKTKLIRLARDSITGLVMITDEMLQIGSKIHDSKQIELDDVDKLQAREQLRYRTLLAAMKYRNQLEKEGKSTAKQDENIKVAEGRYNEAVIEFQEFINQKKRIQSVERIQQAKGLAKTLAGELDQTLNANKEIIKSYDQRRISLISGFEKEKAKAERVHQEKTKALTEAYEKQTIASDKAIKEEQALFDQSLKVNEMFYGEKIRRIRHAGKNEYDINVQVNKAKQEHADKNKELTLHHDKFVEDAYNDKIDVENEYADTIVNVKKGLALKLDKIDKRENDRIVAAENRERRALEVAASAARKRAKLIATIDGGGGKVAKITAKYEADVEAFKNAEFKKSEWADLGYSSREEFMVNHLFKLASNYDADVDAFSQAEASKTLKAQEESAKRATQQFSGKVDESFAGVENGAGGFQDFFGVNLGEQENKQAELLRVKQESLDAIEASEVSADEKRKQREGVTSKFNIKQAELEKQGRMQASKDTWSALSTLGASGSKKLFAISKAANIAKSVMNTYAAANNALASLPPPFNFAAAGLVTAAGLVNVRNIKSQQMPQFHDGISTVERTGSYLLQGGERVMTEKLNKDLKDDLKRRKEGGSGGDTSINLTLPDSSGYNATERWYEDNADRIVNHIKYAMNRP